MPQKSGLDCHKNTDLVAQLTDIPYFCNQNKKCEL